MRMKFFKQFFLWFGSAIAVVLLHFATTALLNTPWSHINTIFIFLILFLLIKESGVVIWMSFIAHFFIELYTANPFGVILFSGTLATLLAFWLYQYFFTNQSWYTATAVSFMTIVIYRILYTGSLGAMSIFLNIELPPWRFLLVTYGWEILFTTIVTAFIYFLIMQWKSPKRYERIRFIRH